MPPTSYKCFLDLLQAIWSSLAYYATVYHSTCFPALTCSFRLFHICYVPISQDRRKPTTVSGLRSRRFLPKRARGERKAWEARKGLEDENDKKIGRGKGREREENACHWAPTFCRTPTRKPTSGGRLAKCQRSLAGAFFSPSHLHPSYFFVIFAPLAFAHLPSFTSRTLGKETTATQATTVCATYLLCLLLKSCDDLYKMVMLKKKEINQIAGYFFISFRLPVGRLLVLA